MHSCATLLLALQHDFQPVQLPNMLADEHDQEIDLHSHGSSAWVGSPAHLCTHDYLRTSTIEASRSGPSLG